MKNNSKILSFCTVPLLLLLLAAVNVCLSAGEITNCLQIANGLCQLCDSKLAMNPTRLACVETKIDNCIFIDESSNCLECACGYVVNFSQKQCIKLPIPIEGCRQVNYQNTCIEPKQYFMITPLGVIPSNESNCKKKSNAWLTPDCVECHSGYYLRNGRCVSLSSSSQSIGNSTAAYLIYNSTTASISISCHVNWYSYSILGSSGCARTIDHCDSYSSSVVGICSSCIPGYFVASLGGVCVRATVELDYCVEVNSIDLTKCIRCLSDEYKVVNGACTTRTTFVNNCILHNSSDDTCLKCDATHYLSVSSTACTTRTAVGCATVPTSTDTCLTCSSGYYFTSSTNSCTLRTYSNVNCLEYSSTTDKCAVCIKTYYVNSAGTCTARVNSVNNCITPTTSEDKCSDCYANAVRKSDGSCIIPSYTHQNCIAVEDTSTNSCTQCTSGFGIISDSSNCADNFQNIPNCAKYTSGTTLTCEVCSNEFILTSDKKKCLIPYGSCIQQAKPCDSFTSSGSTLEKYVCNIVVTNHSWIISSTITLLYSLLFLFIC